MTLPLHRNRGFAKIILLYKNKSPNQKSFPAFQTKDCWFNTIARSFLATGITGGLYNYLACAGTNRHLSSLASEMARMTPWYFNMGILTVIISIFFSKPIYPRLRRYLEVSLFLAW